LAHAPTSKELRKFAIIAVFFFGAIAFLQYRHDRATATYIFAGLSAWGLIAAATVPIVIRPLHWFLTKVAHYIGWFNTRLLLGILFYLFFTPIGLLMRLFGKDLLNQKIDTNADSYWIPKGEKPFDRKDYERQF
jgi:hypothetical protein